ncbi:MAG: lyase domain protein repeat-containing protein, partial [Planctomycetaceae bacterium]|nr:lyase domain protein repeat-containing protein [Planctomycetaceae bacterium]
MPASTLDALQSLKDAEFHALCDEILPRIYPRYYPLVPLGRNERGNSIKGQPDSYVGETAKTCRIAIQYTVQQDSWWSKAVDDVEKARKACPLAQEIVVVLPRDVDRQLPTKGKGVQWQFDAKSAAAPAELTVIHGQTLTQQLDTTCQDLRFLFLGIPISRLSWHALMAGCREANVVTLRRLESLGRYDPSRYVDREADHRFFKLWQESLRSVSGHYSASDRKTLIPLIADSGIGKTSLLAHFAERASLHTPVLLLLARDLSFDKSESLAAHVMERLQGSMDSKARSSEESHLAMILAGKTPLTVVLDGLDETTNTPGVRRAIDTWIWSRLGRSSVLVATSRPEFWRNCRDATWANSILRDDDHPKAAKSLRYERDLATLDPMQGIEIPGKFTERELLKAWCRGGRDENEIWQLPVEVRRELLHPFTMRSALDLIATGTPLDQLSTRSAILELWIQSRLKAEVDIDARITEKQYRACLLILARMAVANPGSWIGIEQLDDSVPRFDRSNPPGGAVERLIAANILETHPEHRDQIRFSFEAVLDFFLAESLINEIAKDPPTSAREFAKLSFSTAVTRLERIGAQIASQPFREEFVRSLADLDGSKAAVVVRPSINSYSSECRAYVVSKVAKLLTSRMEAKRALATELLGRLNCEESRNAIEVQWATNTPTKRIYPLISNAAISHGIVALVPHVFRTRWFSEDHYFVDLRPELFASAQGFRNSLAEYSCKFIPCESHSDDYRRALMVLAYLNDERAVVTIRKRTQDRIPFFYESMCLLAIGSRQAIEVYSSLIDRYIEARKVG